MQPLAAKLSVEVVYALAGEQDLVRLEMEAPATARQAIERSGLLEKFREIDLQTAAIGIFGKRVKHDALLRDRDRVEIYRPLAADPKARRAGRALVES